MHPLPAPPHPVATAAPENLALGSLAELTARAWAARQLVREELAAGCPDAARLAMRKVYLVMTEVKRARLPRLYEVLRIDASQLQEALARASARALADEVA